MSSFQLTFSVRGYIIRAHTKYLNEFVSAEVENQQLNLWVVKLRSKNILRVKHVINHSNSKIWKIKYWIHMIF